MRAVLLINERENACVSEKNVCEKCVRLINSHQLVLSWLRPRLLFFVNICSYSSPYKY
uniref:Uncharacterized protein n=1 Tax=Meloidogyne enterolobii TaxID=390850 RepID=A0A6V7XNT4_MELEN|nr:unnamed protein product [Meloidogyne enterolobii]